MAVIKAHKMEWILQKGTELGMSAFIPLNTARSVVKLTAGSEAKKMVRWTRIAREAAKQCGRSSVPEVYTPLSLPALMEERLPAHKLFLYEHSEKRIRDLIFARHNTRRSGNEDDQDVLILVGPEGGWTNTEAEDIVRHGFVAVSLGDRILRAETAAICCLSLLTQFWN
jgi:16S rRNA (uracil1498-N3)-methyltransferase